MLGHFKDWARLRPNPSIERTLPGTRQRLSCQTLGVMKPIVATVALLYSTLVFAGSPDCAGPERWPTSMAFGSLKNAGITNNDELDFAKTKNGKAGLRENRKRLISPNPSGHIY